MAAEWSPANPLSAWQVRLTGQTSFTPDWICSTDSAHAWQAALSSRANGSGCPECREHGKSGIELDHWSAAERVFGQHRLASRCGTRHSPGARTGSSTSLLRRPGSRN
ncbi:zinc-ribbon domain-containing protein [Streptomyces anthocyanicus]|uniref:zinc-ribbon domain-containing protein n=1 Tax=Streptomyces anthocyanicus TaxID=68174 RepID=UPI00387305F2